uniref:Alpha/beta hydrolase fold-3 domain-containing protein n=2 Tax=Kalmanozyma brasiliensis (strain GHG001) TaxID=1365824 RepID=V5ENX3_KALBG
MDWREERTIPRTSKWLFGRGHEGWCIEAEGVTLPALPTASQSNGHSHSNSNGGIKQRKINGRGTIANKDFIDAAADPTTLHATDVAPSAKPYDALAEGVPTDILRGAVKGTLFGVEPKEVAAFWQWKSVASAVSYGKVISVKPGNDVAGIGSGPAISADERMVLFFVGGGYHSGHAPQGPLSWTVCRQSCLRVLGVNFRKATKDSFAFPAALQDALASWVYVTKRLGFKPENVILMGDSAGGGLALSLQLYLSALLWSGEEGLGRAKKLVLHSPMVDLTLGTESFTANDKVDIISPYMCSLARDNYLRHVISVDGRKNTFVDGRGYGEGRVDEVAARYELDPYSLEPSASESDSRVQGEMKRLASELSETVLELGAFHPLFSLGLDARGNKYLAQCLLLFHPPPSQSDAEMELLVTVGTAEIFHDQIKLFVRNLLDLLSPSSQGKKEQRKEEKVKVSLVECVGWHHVFAFMNLPGKVKAQVDDVAKAFMLS